METYSSTQTAESSEIKGQFYFFGAGKISKIQSIEGKRVKGIISKAFIFVSLCYRKNWKILSGNFVTAGRTGSIFLINMV